VFQDRFHLQTLQKRMLPHGRSLRLGYTDSDLVLRLDQGLGYWMTTRATPFDFTSSLERQVAELKRASFFVRAPSVHPTYIAISDGF
jgi:hypothetical protein